MNRRTFLLASSGVLGAAGLGALYWTWRWKYIVVHHSAGAYGTIELLQRVHRERQAHDPVDAIPYHYVIGNGNGLGLGEVASDWRQEFDIWGAHVSARNSAHNFLGIGICLVGNLDITPLPEKQYEALVALTRRLMSRYSIPADNVTGHGLLAGESTRCPGGHFPLQRFKRAILQA